MVGISMPSIKNRFSFGAPPLITKSLRNEGMLTTPGNDLNALLISLPPPGFLFISFAPILRTLSGLSSYLLTNQSLKAIVQIAIN